MGPVFWNTREIAEDRKSANIFPIFKNRQWDDLDSYNLGSLASLLGKKNGTADTRLIKDEMDAS